MGISQEGAPPLRSTLRVYQQPRSERPGQIPRSGFRWTLSSSSCLVNPERMSLDDDERISFSLASRHHYPAYLPAALVLPRLSRLEVRRVCRLVVPVCRPFG